MIVCITGATSGIGKATALHFAKNGHQLIITGRRKEKLDQLKQEIEAKYNVEVLVLSFDIQNKEAVNQAVKSLKGKWQKIDVLVNNAGLALGKETFDNADISDFETMIDTNVKGLLYITKPIVELMKKNGGGHIINLSSTAAKEVYPGGHVYCATKHAVDALTKGMRIDLLPYEIKVTSIAPGMVDTEFSTVRFKGDKSKADDVYKGFTPLYAEDVADVIYYAATTPKHVNLNDVVLTATAQANSYITLKNA
ncbi:MAG: SDR family NAD(P)-dependent oxidoreductase [Chitinophagales bacterium]|nr:SDR family NAD(P)-dependent oxidoreductase [Bacteroidota bacterium]MCB9226073.1 SDR family NAD(P)-dependent oxidoreductase [Chitinophagales bacterium]